MAKTKDISFRCVNAKVSANDYRQVTVDIEAEPEQVDSILDDIDDETIKEYVQKTFEPEDIFSETQLEKWAESNGYIKSQA